MHRNKEKPQEVEPSSEQPPAAEDFDSIFGEIVDVSTPDPRTRNKNQNDYLRNGIPEKNLLAAVLEMAIRDIASNNLIDREDAIEWFKDDRTESFTLFWICEYLGLDQPALIKGLRRLGRL